ncbi:MAG: hypothetical protein Q8L27_02860 [archaeon]|nr:hypothetical protein [archaeon]
MAYKKAREDFEVFASGVRRLRELEKELDSSDTKNFKQEERDIRRKLKSVHLIPQIERDINELKAKISGVDIGALKAQLDFEQSRKLAMLEQRSEELERQILIARKGMLTKPELNIKKPGKEYSKIEEIPKELSKISNLTRRTSMLGRLLGRESHQIEETVKEVSKDSIEIESLKNKLNYLKKHLEEKTGELKKEVKKTGESLDKRQMSGEVKELEEKIYNLREDIYDKLVEETSESKWMIQKEKENVRTELKNLARASAKLMQEEKEETTNQLLEEINKLKKNIEINNLEIQNRINEIEERRKAERFFKEHQQKVISRSQVLGIKPKFLERIEHIDDVSNPISVKEINILSPFGVHPEKRRKEIKPQSSFNMKDEITELPLMPLSEDELKFSLPDFYKPRESFMPTTISPFSKFIEPEDFNGTGKLQKIPETPNFQTHPKSKGFMEIKKEVENPFTTLPGKREKVLTFEEKPEEPEVELVREVKFRKMRIPNKKFLEEEKYNFFFDNLMGLKDLTFYNPEIYDEIKPLKKFQKTETEKSLENYQTIIQNLLKIRTKLLTGLK